MMKPPLDSEYMPPLPGPEVAREGEPLAFFLHGENGRVSAFRTRVGEDSAAARYRVERTAKFLLWSRGAWRVEVSGPPWVSEHLAAVYRVGGEREFDVRLMRDVYGREFEVRHAERAPSETAGDSARSLGGHLDGCRIGFDLGASDFKIAATRDGEVVFSEEFPWNPKDQADPDYHWRHLDEGLRAAAGRLPRVDAIGGSSAGVIVGNEVKVASLFRSVPKERFDRDVRGLFKRLAAEWRVPVEVANDGDVTALAGAMSLGVRGILGIAMGSSEAAGYIDRSGSITGWLNELAFAPVDYNPRAAADEWSGDRGVGALYFSQQAVNRLLPAAGIEPPADMGLPERLKEVQRLMATGDARAGAIYECIGIYLGYAIPHYARYYDFDHLLLLGRVTTGRGGEILVERAEAVLREAFPEVAGRVTIHVPDEKSRRVGQAVAAASLPTLPR
jgi:predicted NBD/HSP70 family sugar kinase